MKKNDLGRAIVEGACNTESKDLSVELSEISLDAFMDEGVMKEIPILKTIIACRKTWTAIHDQLFLRKVAGFLLKCPEFTEAGRDTFSREYLSDPKKAKNLGDTIVLILDRLDDLEKPQMIANVFAALAQGKIGLESFRRLSSAIDIGFGEDLKSLANQPFDSISTIHSVLLRTGLVQLADTLGVGKDAFSQSASVSYRLTQLGNDFITCMNGVL